MIKPSLTDTTPPSQWSTTPLGDKRGYIKSSRLKELWFHTGTICNLACPFCLEGSKPGDDRLNKLTLQESQPFVDEAVELGVEKFSFTGGEPFVIPDIIAILDYALNFRPCLVLTNGTKPIRTRFKDVIALKAKQHQIAFRISFDFPESKKHDLARGSGSFDLALDTLVKLYNEGFKVSIARHRMDGEDVEVVDQKYYDILKNAGITEQINIVSFPDFLTPGSMNKVPHITEDCMTRYHSPETRSQFMCSYSKMIVKKEGRLGVYACTLVDDDDDYNLGETLRESLKPQIMMKHHRCYSCFALGASCSE